MSREAKLPKSAAQAKEFRGAHLGLEPKPAAARAFARSPLRCHPRAQSSAWHMAGPRQGSGRGRRGGAVRQQGRPWEALFWAGVPARALDSLRLKAGLTLRRWDPNTVRPLGEMALSPHGEEEEGCYPVISIAVNGSSPQPTC